MEVVEAQSALCQTVDVRSLDSVRTGGAEPIETRVGHNPYKMGIVAGADVHSGYAGNEEWDWHGAHGAIDDTPQKRLNPIPNAAGEPGYVVSSAGATAVCRTPRPGSCRRWGTPST